MEYSGSAVPLVLSNAALGTELSLLNHHLARLEARKTGLEEMAASEIKAGKVVPGFALESTSGRVGWTKPIEEVIALGQMMGVDISKPGACTPTQAIKAGLPEDLVGSYSERKVGGLKLVSSSSAGARRAFGRTA
jgi:hypothetical protein